MLGAEDGGAEAEEPPAIGLTHGRRIVIAGGIAALMVWAPAVTDTGATVKGPCHGMAFETRDALSAGDALAAYQSHSSEIVSALDINAATTWTVHRSSFVSGAGVADRTESEGFVDTDFFGIPLPLADLHGSGTSGSRGPYSMSDWSKLGRVIGVWAGSNDCTGYFTLVIADQDPILTGLGGGGLILGAACLIFVLFVAYRRRRVPPGDASGRARLVGATVLGGALGLVSGVGFGLLLMQIGAMSPTRRIDLVLPLVGLAIGVLSGLMGGRRAPPLPAR